VIGESTQSIEARMKKRTKPNIKFAIVAILFFAVIIRLHAGTITVTNTHDSGPGSLRQALADATDGDTITFAVTGTIGLTSGELLADKSVTISGPGADNLAVNGTAIYRVFHIASAKTVSISGLTITNGAAPFMEHGGGIYNDHGSLTLSDCTVSGNVGPYSAGGIFNDGSMGSSSLQINRCVLVNNSAYVRGGAIYSSGDSGSAQLQLNASTLSNNSANGGGAIYNDHGTLMLSDCMVSNNSATYGGGGIYNDGRLQGAATLEVSDTTLSGNSVQPFAGDGGGAIYNDGGFSGSATVHITNSTLSNNSGYIRGGGIYHRGYAGQAILQIENSTLSNNSASKSGGTIYCFGGDGDTELELANTILKANPTGENIFNDSCTITSLGYNLSSDEGGGYLNGPGDQINTDPLLGPLQHNGGPTLTHRPLPGSPAIDAGSPSFTPPPLFDQRGPGFDRVVNGRLDIGSFEVQNGKPTPTPTPRPAPTPRPRPAPHPRPTSP
jgi:predicted outer membrane repeat protein